MSTDLYGHSATREQVRKHIVELKTGNPEKHVLPMGVTEISKRLAISRETVYQYLKEAKTLNEVTVDADGEIIINKQLTEAKNFSTFSEAHPITSDPIIQGWIEKTRLMGHTGKGVKSLQSHIQALQRVCNILKIDPIQLTIDLETSEKYAQSYFNKLVSGEIIQRGVSKNTSTQGSFYQVRMAIRHLMQYNSRKSIAIPRGQGGILSGKIIGHGNYADIDLSDTEIADAEKYIIEKWGLDSDIYRVFFVGIESCARREALFNMSIDFKEDTDEDGATTFFLVAVESKTEHLFGGKFDKYIQRAKTQESLRLAKKKGYSLLWDSKNKTKIQSYDELNLQLKEIYTHLGKSAHYFFEHSFHALRHIGAHYWLRKTDYNYGVVATIGGWTVIDELKKSYGKMPPSVLLRMMKKARKGLDEI